MIGCFHADQTLDVAYLTRTMAKLPGASCQAGNMTTTGSVTSYSRQCTVGGSPMTSSGTVTVTGPDAFTTKSHTHGGAIKMAKGKMTAIPDADLASVARRLGSCKSGDLPLR